ncbi:MAG: exodeoxyribonuclease V subunit alpha [Thiotrichales bacterium]|nr:exodeoxyribonuclease V subunit alpha [Thiotrichales bacterium]
MLDVLREQGHLAAIDRHFAVLISDLDGSDGPELALAAALASAWTRDGHACVVLPEIAGRDWPRPGGVRLPDLDAWIAVLDASPMVARAEDAERRPLVLDGRGRLYLDRLWAAETDVAMGLLGLAGATGLAGAGAAGPATAATGLAGATVPQDGDAEPPQDERPEESARDRSRSGRDDHSAGPPPDSRLRGNDGAGARSSLPPGRESAGPDVGANAQERVGVVRARTGSDDDSDRSHRRGAEHDGAVRGPEGLDAGLDRLFPGAASGDRAVMAARTAACRRLCVVSGGPGTGKTTIAAAIVALLIELRLAAPERIVLAAPTGKAAARLQEAVRGRHRTLVSRLPALAGYEAHATTVHRWLHRQARDRRPIDALVLDESSMVDLTLMARVLAALPGHARLVLLGDASQLASVQPGAVFADVCRAGTRAGVARAGHGVAAPTASGVDTDGAGGEGGATASESSPLASCVVALVRNWRFDEAGGIGRLAAAVVRGDAGAAVAALLDPADTATELRPLADARQFERLATAFADKRFAPALRTMQSEPAAREQAHHDAGLRRPPRFEMEPIEMEPSPVVDDERSAFGPTVGSGALPTFGSAVGSGPLQAFRVLCAHRVGAFGAERFNRLVERRLGALGLVPADDAFYPGRPILVTRNDPRTGLSNGDTGIVVRDADGRIRVWFAELEDAEGRPRLVAPARLPPHESFFAVTVHRAQGSEYDEVAVVVGPAESRVATRELLYTAVTRARRRVVVYGSEESVAAAVGRATERYTGLREALCLRWGVSGAPA